VTTRSAHGVEGLIGAAEVIGNDAAPAVALFGLHDLDARGDGTLEHGDGILERAGRDENETTEVEPVRAITLATKSARRIQRTRGSILTELESAIDASERGVEALQNVEDVRALDQEMADAGARGLDGESLIVELERLVVLVAALRIGGAGVELDGEDAALRDEVTWVLAQLRGSAS
jgi:hypothetical protein